VARKLEELLIWHKAHELWDAVNAIIDRPGVRRDSRLHNQLADAIDSVVANIAEGFEQPTDRAFARYLYTSKASAAESAARLLLALKRKHIEQRHFDQGSALATELLKMLDGFINYLIKSDRKDRAVEKTNARGRKRGRRSPRQVRHDDRTDDY
jgi:four helix bundle protein